MGDVAIVGCCDERIEKTSLLGRTHADSSAISDVLASAGYQLARVGLVKLKCLGDVAVRIVECLPEDERGAFGRCQPFQQQHNP